MNPKIASYAVIESIQMQLDLFLKHPILILWGMKDFCFTRHFLNRWQLFFPHAEVHKFLDSGHYIVEDAYERMIPIIRNFLSK